MSICKPLYPTKQRFSQIPDVSVFNLVDSNPILRFNQRQVTVLNVLNNALLINAQSSAVLDNYPFLKARFEQSPITDEEFADFLFEQSLSVQTVQEAYLNNFPVPVDIQVVSNFVDIVDTAIQQTIKDLLDENNTTDMIPAVPSVGQPVVTNVAPTTSSDGSPLAATDNTIDDVPVDRFIPSTNTATDWVPSPDVENVLNELNNYYEENFSTPISDTKLCSDLSNPFAKLSSLIANATGFINKAAGLLGAGLALLDSAQGLLEGLQSKVNKLVSDIKNFSIANLVKGLVSKLNNVKEEILSLVDNLKDKMLSKIENLKATALQFINEVKTSAKRLYTLINKKIQQAKTFFQDFNIEKLKSKVESVLKLNSDQFEDLLPAVLNLLILGGCNISNAVSAFMQNPVNELKGFLDKLTLGYNVAETFSVLTADFAIAAGAIRVEPARREEERRSGARTHNEGRPAQQSSRPTRGTVGDIAPGNYVTLEMSSEERQFVSDLTEDGNQWFIFADAVKNMGKIATEQWNSTRRGPNEWDPTENYPEAGWKVISERNPFIWAALKRVATKLQDVDGELSGPLTINSAFRSRWYNRIYQRQILGNRGAAVNSMHMSAMALDISTNGLSNQGVAKLIQRLSEEGFSRISVYNSFVHADIKDMGSYRGNWTRNYRGNTAIRRAMELHLADSFRSGNQRIVSQTEGTTSPAPTSPGSTAARTEPVTTNTTTRSNASSTPGSGPF